MRTMMGALDPMIRGMAGSIARTVVQRLGPLQPLLQSPAQTAPLVGALVSEVRWRNRRLSSCLCIDIHSGP